ncbi:MAG TPA: ECF-type sigma factor [Bryobacteraceae bacterium]|nr:ECF-type sigma factor [Bryobacteraceae bacterium]
MAATALPALGDGALSFETLYQTLRKKAKYYLAKERNACSMSPTVLVHEAWLSLARSTAVNVADGSHYVRLIGRVMRNLLIDYARRKKALINGGALERVEWADDLAALREAPDNLLALEAALDKLALQCPSLAAVVELRYFAGLTEEEAAQVLGISARTVRRQWRLARLRLLHDLTSRSEEPTHDAQ